MSHKDLHDPQENLLEERKTDGSENKKVKRKKFPLLFFILFILILSLYPALSTIKMNWTVEKDITTEEPNYVIREVNETTPEKVYTCENKGFRYSATGGNVDSLDGRVRPNLILTNLEERPGVFYYNFSYMDDSIYPYDIFGGAHLTESLNNGNITSEDAAFESITYSVNIEARDSVFINNDTPIPKEIDARKKFWAIAHIREPVINVCSYKTTYSSITLNKTYTEYKEVTKKVKVNEKTPVTEILGISNFFQWFILVILLFVIIVLAQKILERRKQLSEQKE